MVVLRSSRTTSSAAKDQKHGAACAVPSPPKTSAATVPKIPRKRKQSDIGHSNADLAPLPAKRRRRKQSLKVGAFPESPLSGNFPSDLVDEILRRLPVKSVGRFRCVSKSWRTHLSSDYFTRWHLKTAVSNPDHLKILVQQQRASQKITSCSLLSVSEHDEPEDMGTLPLKKCIIVGHCDGLLCVKRSGGSALHIWNPCTREKRTLPPSKLVTKDDDVSYAYGFGYDSRAQDYKVVKITEFRYLNHAVMEVLLLKEGVWKKIRELNCNIPFGESGQAADGVLLWILHRNRNVEIAVFDLATDEFRVLPCVPGYNGCFNDLWTVGGNVCFLYHKGSVTCPNKDDVLMKRGTADVNTPWTRLGRVKVPYPSEPLHVCKHQIVLFNPIYEYIRRIEFKDDSNFQQIPCHYAKVYTQSLISPHGNR